MLVFFYVLFVVYRLYIYINFLLFLSKSSCCSGRRHWLPPIKLTPHGTLLFFNKNEDVLLLFFFFYTPCSCMFFCIIIIYILFLMLLLCIPSKSSPCSTVLRFCSGCCCCCAHARMMFNVDVGRNLDSLVL